MKPFSYYHSYRARLSRPLLAAGCCLVLLAASIRHTAAQSTTAGGAAVGVARTIPFTGAVFSDEGHPLAGATVAVVDRSVSTVTTNAEGFFLLSLPAGVPVRLVVAFPDHVSQQVDLRTPESEKNLVVTLQRQKDQPGKAGRGRTKSRRQ